MATDYFVLEKKRSELIENTLNTSSFTLRVFLFYKYFTHVLSLEDRKAEEAFLEEFLDDYLSALTKFEVWGIDPGFTEKLLSQLKDLGEREIAAGNEASLKNTVHRINEQYHRLLLTLKEGMTGPNYDAKACFPVIDQSNKEGFYGVIESVTVRISRGNRRDNFIIVPSDKNIDIRITEQCHNSWQVALKALKKYVRKPFEYHEVIISFEKKEGYYEGDSLGTALTVAFLEQLMNFYNPVYSLKLTSNVAFTGAVNGEGKTLPAGGEVIKQKTAAVFYSDIRTFVFPKADEIDVADEFGRLINEYPERELKLAAAEDVTDILNRRDLVEIKKRNMVLRTGRFVRKNLILVSINIFLLMLITFFLLKDIDSNPFTYTADGKKIYIKNRSGKILWEKNVAVPEQEISSPYYLKRMVKIVDINSDGENEVILAGIDNEGSVLRCYAASGEALWHYSFKDEVYSQREILSAEYNLVLLDTLNLYGNRSLFLIANNYSSFSSAILRIDLKTGKRLPGTFWSSGLGADAIIKDIDDDKHPDILGIGYDNGYEDVVFFVFRPDTVTRVRPTTPEYLIQNYPVSVMECYIRFPKTDYDIYYKYRTPSLGNNCIIDDKSFRKYKFGVSTPQNIKIDELGYDIGYNFKDIDVIINSRFRIIRDTLVAHGILKPPYTDTEEYKNIIKNNILYWKGGTWVKRQEID